MAIIESHSPEVASLAGLHLYHAGKSACAARVRLLLEEKGLEWTGHYVDIYKRENVSERYFAINPKGLVPTLVHDGRVVIESNDILLYLEEHFPDPPFRPADPALDARMRGWMQRCADMHLPGVKTFAYARLHAANVVKTDEEVALYRRLQSDPDLLAFHAKHDGPAADGFAEQEVEQASALLHETLAEMDAAIAQDGWLAGAAYSLADMSWATAVTMLRGAGFDFAGLSALDAWYERVAARPAYEKAVLAWRRGD